MPSNFTMLTVGEVAEQLRVSSSSIYGLIETGKLACHRIGVGRGTIRIDERDLDTFLNACRTSPRSLPRRKQPQPTLKHLKI